MDSANANLCPSRPATLAGDTFVQRGLFDPKQHPDALQHGKVLLTSSIRALTVSQPYASLIADGVKWVENRRWATNYRGPLAIHAGKGTQYLTKEELRAYPTGAVIAVVELATCIPLLPGRLRTHGSRVLDQLGLSVDALLNHEHTEGPFCWILRRVRKLDVPHHCSGKQGLWSWGRNGLMVAVSYRPDIILRQSFADQEATP
jgi:activating signal cointegrator 1